MVTVLSRLDHHAKTRPDAPAYCRKETGAWKATSWATYRDEVRAVARALIALGLEPGGAVGVLGANRPEWTSTALGAMAAGGAAAGIYTTNAPEQVAFVLRHCGARIAVVENAHQLAKIDAARPELPDLEWVIVLEDSDARGEGVLSWSAFLERGDEVLGSVLDQRLHALRTDQLATLIYTSGTTGTPKGVMLSHGNLLATVKMIVAGFDLQPSDVGLSYLPQAHIAEQMMTVHMPTYVGCVIYYAEPVPERIPENLREVRPTIFFGVPRVWERFASGIQAKLATASPARRRLAEWALGVQHKALGYEHRGSRPGVALAVQRRLADRLVGAKIRQALGFDRLRLASSGAAPIAAEILKLFAGFGITIYEVYGLSESTGPATWCQPGRTRFGTVGPPLDTIEVRLADDGEVLVRGPNVFLGYLGHPQATAEALVDGWLHTGDLGAFDDDGYLRITGRKKNLIITSGGKNIAPEGIETALKQSELISEAVVLGDDRRFVVALLTLDEAAARRFLEGTATTDLEGVERRPLHEDPRILAAVQASVDDVNRRLSRVEGIRRFRILPRALSQDEGELTPTLKVKRDVVQSVWSELIDTMYEE